MRALRTRLSIAVALAAAVALLSAGAAAGDPADGGRAATCVSVRTDARYVPYGYNHVVILSSACKAAATCSVSTDVNPQPTATDVAPGATVEVVTFMGSPSQTFTAKVACTFK